MTDRIVSLTVFLKKETRVDDAEYIKHAIEMIKGVEHVEDGPVVAGAFEVAKENAKNELRKELLDLLTPDWLKKGIVER